MTAPPYLLRKCHIDVTRLSHWHSIVGWMFERVVNLTPHPIVITEGPLAGTHPTMNPNLIFEHKRGCGPLAGPGSPSKRLKAMHKRNANGESLKAYARRIGHSRKVRGAWLEVEL